jgi:hypothetical protein
MQPSPAPTASYWPALYLNLSFVVVLAASSEAAPERVEEATSTACCACQSLA